MNDVPIRNFAVPRVNITNRRMAMPYPSLLIVLAPVVAAEAKRYLD